MKYRSFLIITLFLILTVSLPAQNSKTDKASADTGEKKSEGIIIEPDVNYWGMNADISIYGIELFEDLSSRVLISGGAGLRNIGYYRDDNDEFIEEDDGSYDIYSDFTHFRIHTNWGIGFTQGIINNEGCRNDLVYAVFKYRGIREWNLEDDSVNQILFNSVREDSDGILLNSFIGALVYECVKEDKRSGNIKGFTVKFPMKELLNGFLMILQESLIFINITDLLLFYIPLNDF